MSREPALRIDRGRARLQIRWARRIAGTLLLLCVASGAATRPARVYREGNSWVEESSGTLAHVHSLRVNTTLGDLKITGGGKELRWTVHKRFASNNEQEARRQFDRLKVSTTGEADFAVLEANDLGEADGRFNAEFELQVPAEIKLIQVANGFGTISVSNVSARLELITHAGSISLDKVGGNVRARTLGGNLKFGKLGGSLWAKSGGGKITIDSLRGHIELNTLGGDIAIGSIGDGFIHSEGGNIQIQRCAGELKVETGGGDVNVGEAGGRTSLATREGNIRLGSSNGPVVAVTGGGNIDLWKLAQGARAQSNVGRIQAEFISSKGAAESLLQTSAGNIVIYIRGGVPATVHAETAMSTRGGINSEFPELKIASQGGDYGINTTFAEGGLNGGGPVVNLRTLMGQINIRRAQ